MFGMDVLTQPQIDVIVLDFPIFPTRGNGGAQNVDFGPKIGKVGGGVRPSNLLGGKYEHPYRR